MDSSSPSGARPTRGAKSNRSGRYERLVYEALSDDDPGSGDTVDDSVGALRTIVTDTPVREIIARNDSPDIPFDRSINPYRGCEHGCIYCFARPSHAFLGLSPGLDFETRLFAKRDAPERLRAALRRRGYRPAPLALGANTDPYQPVERRLGITRGILEVLQEARHPVVVVTKGLAVLRDVDLLAAMSEHGLAVVLVSLATLDASLAARMEPRAPPPASRLRVIADLVAAGVPVGILTSPMIPGLNDHEIEALLAAAACHGASRARYTLLRLPGEVADLFQEWLRSHFPDRAERVLSLQRQCRGGRLSDADFGRRMRGEGPVAAIIAQRFARACRRYGLDRPDWSLDCSLFRPPLGGGGQFDLFGTSSL